MGKPSDHPEFQALYAEWNQKLLEEGFEDVEELKKGQFHLKRSGSAGRFEQLHPIVRDAKVKYYEIIGKKINETKFDDEQERQIMTLHHEGFTHIQIGSLLQPSVHRVTVYRKLYKWLRIWGLK